MHLFSEGGTVSRVSAEDPDRAYVANGNSGNELRSRLRATANDADRAGGGSAEVADGYASDCPCPDLAEPFAQDDALQFSSVGTPDSDDL